MPSPTEELRSRVMRNASVDCRLELIAALTIIDRLEADFETLAIEIAKARTIETTGTCLTSKRFDDMCRLRGIVP